MLQNVYKRYESLHLHLSGTPTPVQNRAGETVGYVDLVELTGGRLRVSGWVFARKVLLVLGGAQSEAATMLRRPDVAKAIGCDELIGFELSVPGSREIVESSAPPGLVFTAEPGQAPIDPVSLPIRYSARSLRRMRWRFVRELVMALPPAVGWWATRNPAYRAKIKSRLRLKPQPSFTPMETRIFRADGDVDQPAVRPQRITIVLPVYNAFDLLQECLSRVERHTDLPFRLVLIEDRSTDERVRPFLREWSATREFSELLENKENLGFIGAVNRGLTSAMEHGDQDEGPVILLNSDALVPERWASRLIRPFQNHEDIASVTPMSNDAEIMSVPVICQRTVLRSGQAEAIDAQAQRFAPEALLTVVPTGVGFCMALGRDWLAKLGHLDTRFGRGYGEEVDWCQKIAHLGGRHLALPGLFVEHRGGESFGSEAKLALVAANNRIIGNRYPQYDRMVQDFIATDPLGTARLALGLAWAGSLNPSRAVPVYLAHSLGGGADIHLEHRIQNDLDLGHPSVVLRIGGRLRWQLELIAPNGRSYGQTDDFEFIARLLACLPRRKVVYSCGVGDRDPVQLPELLLSILQPEDAAEVHFHDYFPISPAYTLLDSDGVYRGPVTAARHNKAHRSRRPDGSEVSLQAWQAAWSRFLERADLVVFSRDSAQQVETVWPELRDRIVLRPHQLHQTVTPLTVTNSSARPVIGVLGNIGFQKGAAVLRDLVRLVNVKADAPQIVLIGNIDPAYALPEKTPQHGSYAIKELPDLVERYGITHWLIPSVWPETFCYTVHEALATGLPVMAFGIGAQGDAVRAAPNGIPVPFGDGADLAGRVLDNFNGYRSRPAGAIRSTVSSNVVALQNAVAE